MVQFYDEYLCNLQSYLHTFKEISEQSDYDTLSKILNNHIFDQVIGQNVIGLSMYNASLNKGNKKSISKSVLDKYSYVWCNFCLCHQ